MLILGFEKLFFKMLGVGGFVICGRAHVSGAGDNACSGDGDILGLTPSKNIYFRASLNLILLLLNLILASQMRTVCSSIRIPLNEAYG